MQAVALQEGPAIAERTVQRLTPLLTAPPARSAIAALRDAKSCAQVRMRVGGCCARVCVSPRGVRAGVRYALGVCGHDHRRSCR